MHFHIKGIENSSETGQVKLILDNQIILSIVKYLWKKRIRQKTLNRAKGTDSTP